MIRVEGKPTAPVSIEEPLAPLVALPYELIFKILPWLDVRSMHACSLVSRELNQIVQDNYLWTQLYLRDFKHFFSRKLPLPESDQHAYKIAHTSEFNRLNGIYHMRTIAECEGIVHCVRVFGGQVFLAIESKDEDEGDIRVHDLKTGELLKQIYDEESFPRTLDVSDGMLFVGYESGRIEVLDIRTWECLKNIEGNGAITGPARSILYCNGRLHVGFLAGMIQIWDIKSGDLIKTLNEDAQQLLMGIVSLAFSGRTLFVGDEMGNTRCWNMATWECRAFPKPQFPQQCTTIPLNKGGDLLTFNFFNNGKVCCPNMFSYKSFKTWLGISFQGHEGQVLLPTNLDGNLLPVANDWTYVYYDDKSELICSLDFKASHSDVFRQIATQFLEGGPESAVLANDRFIRMPTKAKNQVYEILHSSLLDSFKVYEKLCSAPNPFRKPNDLDLTRFYESLWIKSDPMRKAEAILTYEANSAALSESWEGPARCPKKLKTDS